MPDCRSAGSLHFTQKPSSDTKRSVSSSLGYEFAFFEKHFVLSQDAYLNWLTNLQDWSGTRAPDGSAIDELEDVLTQVSGFAYGLETKLMLDPTLRVFGWAAYTLSRSDRRYPLGGRRSSDWDQRHILNVVLGYRLNHKWSFGTRVHYHTGRPWTAPLDGQSQSDALTYNRNNQRLPAFFQLDVRIERTFTWDKWRLSAYLDVGNATFSREVIQCEANRNSITATNRMGKLVAPVSESRGVASCTPVGLNYFLPALGLKATF